MKEPAPWWHFDPALDRRQYVQRVLDAYRQTPTCAGHVRAPDRRLAHRLYDQRIPIRLVEAALTLAALRRLYRADPTEPLLPIRSLHYVLPILDDIRQQAIDPGYIDYIRWKLQHDAPQLERAQESRQRDDPQLP